MLEKLPRLFLSITMKKRRRHHLVHHEDNLFSAAFRLLLLRRPRHRLFPLLYAASGCLLIILAAFSVISPPPAASVPQTFVNDGEAMGLSSRPEVVFRVPASGGSSGREFWSSSKSNLFRGCSNSSATFQTADMKTHPNRYLVIATSGGLNQQRTGITDGVVVSYILNATLVVPKLDQKSYWKDSSNFAEIFDVDWFISSLSKDVKIIRELPLKDGKVWNPYGMRVPRKCSPKCYEDRVLPALNKRHAIQLSKFDYRLSNRLGRDLQKLRCRVNYHALRFTDPILEMGKLLVERMRKKTEHFIALHLRFEPDMLAFSGCYYGGGEKERTELGVIRKRWKTLHTSNPDKMRRHGRCPLSPEEVGLMLRALGFGSDVHIYVASGKTYGGDETLSPLRALFPNFHSKETIATPEELAPFLSFSSRMAALDFIVCDESDVFVTNNNGNMAKMLAGRRRYFGHKPTIRPNTKKLYKLFMNRTNTSWEEFASKVRTYQIGFMGEPNELKPGSGEFHENPSSCICKNSGGAQAFENQTLDDYKTDHENDKQKTPSDMNDEPSMEDDPGWADMNDLDKDTGGLPNLSRLELSKLEKTDVGQRFSD